MNTAENKQPWTNIVVYRPDEYLPREELEKLREDLNLAYARLAASSAGERSRYKNRVPASAAGDCEAAR